MRENIILLIKAFFLFEFDQEEYTNDNETVPKTIGITIIKNILYF